MIYSMTEDPILVFGASSSNPHPGSLRLLLYASTFR